LKRGVGPQKELDMDRITALKARRAGILEKMEALVSASSDDGFTAEQQAEFDAHKVEDDRVAKLISEAEDVERRKAAAAKPVAALPGVTPSPVLHAQPKAPDEKGLRFARMFRALSAAGGIPYVAAQIAETEWGESGLFANQNMGSGSAGGFLVNEDVSSEIIELLRPASVVMSLNPVSVPMPSGNMTMNRLATGSSARYIGEQQAAPATSVAFGQVKLSAKKLAALIPISNDLMRASSFAADRIVRDDLVSANAQAMDLAFLRGSGTEFTPRGLRFQNVGTAFATSHILTMTGSPTLTTVTSDLARLELALMNADVPMTRAGWIMAPRVAMYIQNLRDGNGNFAFPEMSQGLLRGKPYRTTTQIPINLGGGSNESEVILADFAHVIVGEHMGISIATSDVAAYVDASSTIQAAFSRDETALRTIQQHDLGVRHLPAVAVLTGVTWTP
jgi:HK97 family phage major capsid protein